MIMHVMRKEEKARTKGERKKDILISMAENTELGKNKTPN